MFKFRATANNLNMAKKTEFVNERVENISGRDGNACYQHVSFSLYDFKRLPLWSIKFGIVWYRVKEHIECGSSGKVCIRKNAKHLTLSQTTNFRLFLTERVCRRQF